MRKFLLGAAVASLAIAGAALAQSSLTFRSLTGSETFLASVGGPQGSSFFAPASQVRNSQGVQVSALTTGTLVLANQSPATLILTGAATSGLTIDLPPVPWDGEIFEVVNGTGSAFVSAPALATTDGSAFVNGSSVTTLAAGGSKEWRYSLTTNSWYGMR